MQPSAAGYECLVVCQKERRKKKEKSAAGRINLRFSSKVTLNLVDALAAADSITVTMEVSVL